ncbi:MAG: FAD-binding protein [Sulfurimonas sp.]|nr:FAD-binding protein [Sulfurimonas sp.]
MVVGSGAAGIIAAIVAAREGKKCFSWKNSQK